MATRSKKQKELDELYVGKEARGRVRESAVSLKKREEDGQWTSGMGMGSTQMLALLDYIDELETKLLDKQIDDKINEEK